MQAHMQSTRSIYVTMAVAEEPTLRRRTFLLLIQASASIDLCLSTSLCIAWQIHPGLPPSLFKNHSYIDLNQCRLMKSVGVLQHVPAPTARPIFSDEARKEWPRHSQLELYQEIEEQLNALCKPPPCLLLTSEQCQVESHSNAHPGAVSTAPLVWEQTICIQQGEPSHSHTGSRETTCTIRCLLLYSSPSRVTLRVHRESRTYLQNTHKERARGQALCNPHHLQEASSASKQTRLNHQCF